METRSNSRPPFLDTDALVKGSSDGTKQFRIEVDGFTTGTTRVLTPPDANLTLAAVTAVGDMLYASASGILTRLPLGTALQKFRVNAGATAPEWYTDDYEVGTWTPSLTSGSGTITTVGAVSGVYTKNGNVVVAEFSITITTNGTAASSIIAAGLPFTSTAHPYIGSGRENGATGNMLQLYLAVSSSAVTIKNYNDSYPAGSGYTMFGTITYRTS